MKLLKLARPFFIILLLTIVTQIGGFAYFIFLPIYRVLKKRFAQNDWKRKLIPFLSFLVFYLLTTFLVVPPIAKKFGREVLPYFSTKALPVQPRNYFYVLANRNYVRSELKNTVFEAAKALSKKYPEAKILYLDGCFPFWNGIPLIPHLSHSDGKKLDICFLYKHKTTGQIINKTPTWMGYGSSEMPQSNEYNQPKICKDAGYFQYSFLNTFTPRLGKSILVFDEKANRWIVEYFAKHPSIGKIFIEPHLKTRLELSKYDKIRFHGCRAVRHDDHIHLQL